VIEKETSCEVRSKVFETICRDLKIVNGERKIYKLAKTRKRKKKISGLRAIMDDETKKIVYRS